MSKFDDFVRAALKESAKLARGAAAELSSDIEDDAEAFIKEAKERLTRWTSALAQGKLDRDEFASLVKQQKALAKMQAITAAGMTVATVKRLREGIINAVISAAVAVFL